ncbi:MAG: porin [Rhizobiales bacterium]|nr:porin [Hyphomicrobiales bacterium]MBN9009559.1 porin [Hyphomicrobiales bacterium]
MNIKTLLLGTATAFVAVSGAQAADLAVAEPVEYVKVCDAYGAGYFYIPGSDTCLKIGGYVKSYVDFYDNQVTNSAGSDRNFTWTTETSINVTAQSMTDIGLLTGWVDYRAKKGSTTDGHAYIDSAYLKAGPVKMGYFTNIYYYNGAFGEIGPGAAYDATDNSDNQLVFSTSMGGLGLWLGIADNSTHPDASDYLGNFPDFIAALTGTAGGFDWKLAGAVTDTVYGTGWGVQAAGTWTAASGDAIRVKAAVGNGYGNYYVDTSQNGGIGPMNSGDTIWSALVAGVHYWSSTVSTSASASYSSKGAWYDGGDQWDIGLETDWLVAKNLTAAVAVDYYTPEIANGNWSAEFRLVRAW